MTLILGIDPGPVQSGVVYLKDGKAAKPQVMRNEEVLELIRNTMATVIAIEMIASYGMPVGADVFETCVWIGKFEREAEMHATYCSKILRIPRKDVKLHLCGSPRAKDPNIRQRLIDLLGAPGTKKQPGGTYGVKSHAWAALAVAVTAAEKSEAIRRVA